MDVQVIEVVYVELLVENVIVVELDVIVVVDVVVSWITGSRKSTTQNAAALTDRKASAKRKALHRGGLRLLSMLQRRFEGLSCNVAVSAKTSGSGKWNCVVTCKSTSVYPSQD